MSKTKTVTMLDVCRSIRRPMPPPTRRHTTKSGKKGYNRRDNKRIEREACYA